MGLMADKEKEHYPIVAEVKRTRSRARTIENTESNQNENKHITAGKTIVQVFTKSLIENINSRIKENKCSNLIKDCFKSWDILKLSDLLDIANSSRRGYGTIDIFQSEVKILKERFSNLNNNINDMSKWLMFCNNEKYYKSIQNILHFALSLLFSENTT